MGDTQPALDYLFASSHDALEAYFLSCENRRANIERALLDFLRQWIQASNDEQVARRLLCLRTASPDLREEIAARLTSRARLISGRFLITAIQHFLPLSGAQRESLSQLLAARPAVSPAGQPVERTKGTLPIAMGDPLLHCARSFHGLCTATAPRAMPSVDSAQALGLLAADTALVLSMNSPRHLPVGNPPPNLTARPVNVAQPTGISVALDSRPKPMPRLRRPKQLLRAMDLARCAKKIA